MRHKVLLADEHRILTEGLTSILGQHYEIAAAARTGHELVFLAKQQNPDVILTEIALPQLNGLDAFQLLKKAGLSAKLVVLTSYLDVNLAIEAFRAGASGYVIKVAGKDEVISAIESAVRGRTYLSNGFPLDLVSILSEAVRRPAGAVLKLTRRQKEVLQLVAEGKTMKEVALILSISTRTAESYKYEIMRILGLHSNAELVHYAIRIGLITIPQLKLAA